jgi:predicted metal-binding membrane protein
MPYRFASPHGVRSAMAEASVPLARERRLILGSLIALAAAAWMVLLWQAALADREGMRTTMEMAAPVFMANWVAMMVAMMFPTAAPMILTFAAIHAGKRQRGQSFVPTWVFVTSYLVIWVLFGVLAYVFALGAGKLAQGSMWWMENAVRVGGAVIVLAGLYQLSPLKRICLSKCRTPLDFILTSWRDGYVGAFRMGLAHGAYCLGCCWLLFVILFPLGVMNIAAMVLITLLIFAEKSLPAGRHIGKVTAVALMAYGTLVMFVPAALPTGM